MESEATTSLLLLLAKIAVGFITMKAAELRGTKGSPALWFIGGAVIPLVALPAAVIKLDPRRQLDRFLLKLVDRDLKMLQQCTEFVKKVALKCYPTICDLKSKLAVLKMWREGN
jgi:hypothetical protein